MAEIDEGSVIGNYRVIRLLGQGGMGTVYEVEHLELGTHYALKTFTFDPDNDANHALKKKFLEEGKLLARLKHPNLTHVFDLGFEDETQMPYFVMDLVVYEDGETYTVEDIDLKDIDEDMVYGWFKQLASALDYIHGEGIVHRDIKPSNLLVDKDLNVVLTDFGISRIFGQKIKSEVEATRTMVSKTGRGKLVLGTEHYIAPEVADGEEATPKADAYSLGVMLLRWLTGFYYGDNPGALALLSRKKYQWVGVISQLLAPASRRPEKYSELVRQLKPAPKPAAAAKPPQDKKKRNRTKENITAAVLGILIVSILGAGGYFGWRVWQQSEAAKRQQQEQLLAMQKQIAEAKAAAEAAEAAQKAKEAEEKRIAEEKRKAREAKIAEQRRIEESRTKIEKQDASQLAVRETPKVETPEPEPEKPKEEFIVVKDETAEEDTKDYGSIPDKKYVWLKGGNAKFPQEVKFQLANGEILDLIPLEAGAFLMLNERKSGKICHKVSITRPFWMSRFCVTVAQLRDLAPDDYEAYRALEKVVGGKYPIYPNTSLYAAHDWCNYLTKRYRQQLPRGYVFRLPTEAELEYAADVEGTASKYLDEKDGWYSSVAYDTQEAEFEKLRKKLGLDKLGKWDWNWSWWGWLERPRAFVGGRTKPHASGVCDFFMNSVLVLDRYRSALELLRSHDEEDPFNWVEGPFEEKEFVKIQRRKLFERYHVTRNPEGVFHVVVGPDIIAEGKWRIQNEDSVVGVAPMAGKAFELATIPKKSNRACVQDLAMENTKMIFCGIPSGKFKMTNFDNGVKKFHRVEITKPFWMSKFCVTMEQWSEFGIHDCETFGKELRRYFPKEKYPICVSRDRHQWDVFCDYLTQKYGNRIPKGYVFRLPTEAEWEWAMIGKENGSVEDIKLKKWDNWDEQVVGDFRKLLKRKRVPVGLKVDETGYARGRFAGEGWHAYRYYIGGRLSSSILGVTDNIVGELMMFDTFQTDGTAWDAAVQDYIKYNESEIDPCRYDGRYAQRTLVRSGNNRKSLQFMTRIFLAHVVIGPDYGGACRLREDSLYSNEAYGGVFLGDRCKILELSSADTGDELNSSERHAALIDRSPAKFDDHINFRTKGEPSPWIDLELDKPYQLSGVRVEILEWEHIAYPLRVWASIDRKKWMEIGADDRKLKRFEFDVSAKKIQARFIRVGRERGVKSDNFGLSKILIYGKK